MATGDLLSWTINTLRQFKLAYKIDLAQFSQIDGPRDTSAIADFPYQQATLTVAGAGRYHDLGRFFADFENQFPYIRLQNLSIEPAPSSQASEEKEKLSFRMDVVSLVKPGANE
jgi:Tfp pilus assembly protein PilO